jgi:hypothetical protein
VRCGTTDNSTQADDGIVCTAIGQFLGCQWNLECSRDPGNVDILVVTTMADQGVYSSFQQTLGDEAVETADDDPEFEAFGFKLSFKELWHVDLPKYGLAQINWIRALKEPEY